MIGEPAWGEGQRGRGVDPLPEIDIDEVDADGGGPDADLPFLGVPELHLLPPHHLGAAELMDPDGLGLHHDAVAGAAEAKATGGGRGWTGAGGRGHCEGTQRTEIPCSHCTCSDCKAAAGGGGGGGCVAAAGGSKETQQVVVRVVVVEKFGFWTLPLLLLSR